MDSENAVKTLKAIIDTDCPFDEKLTQILELGNTYLGTNMGIISRVRKKQYYVYQHASPPDTLSIGQTFPLGITYCQLTLVQQKIVAVKKAGSSLFRNHPAYGAMQLETYIGTPLLDTNKNRMGTVNFSRQAERPTAFTEQHKKFVQQIADWLSTQLASHTHYLEFQQETV